MTQTKRLDQRHQHPATSCRTPWLTLCRTPSLTLIWWSKPICIHTSLGKRDTQEQRNDRFLCHACACRSEIMNYRSSNLRMISSIHPSIHPSIHAFAHSFMHSCHSYHVTTIVSSFMHSCVHSLMSFHPCHAFICAFIQSVVRTCIPFTLAFILMFVEP